MVFNLLFSIFLVFWGQNEVSKLRSRGIKVKKSNSVTSYLIRTGKAVQWFSCEYMVKRNFFLFLSVNNNKFLP